LGTLMLDRLFSGGYAGVKNCVRHDFS
jgi:hypothetical protein